MLLNSRGMYICRQVSLLRLYLYTYLNIHLPPGIVYFFVCIPIFNIYRFGSRWSSIRAACTSAAW